MSATLTLLHFLVWFICMVLLGYAAAQVAMFVDCRYGFTAGTDVLAGDRSLQSERRLWHSMSAVLHHWYIHGWRIWLERNTW